MLWAKGRLDGCGAFKKSTKVEAIMMIAGYWKIWEELLLEWRSSNIIASFLALINEAYKTYALFGTRLRFLRELHVVNTAS